MIDTDRIEQEARAWFVRLRDDGATVDDWTTFRSWLETSEGHRAAYDRVEDLWLALEAISDSEPSAGGPGAVVVSLQAARPRSAPTSAWRRVLAPSLAAAAGVALTVGLWTHVSGGQVYSAGERPLAVVLEDGSRLDLNRHTRVRVRLASDRRTVFLSEGEASFDVRHDATRPFLIRAGQDEVRVLGTAFNVVRDGSRLEVSVSRGGVAVDTGEARTWSLKAGQALSRGPTEAVRITDVDPAAVGSWRQGLLVYRDADLADVAEDVSRYLDKPVTVEASVRNVRFTGVLRVGDEAAMLQQIEAFLPVRATSSDAQVRLSGRA